MQQVELSATLNDQIPTLAVWLSGACFNVSVFSGTPKPDRGVIRILTPGEIASATHRDILVEWREGAPELVRAGSGWPARAGFGFADAALGHALVRSEERRVGKGCVSTCRPRWSPEH